MLRIMWTSRSGMDALQDQLDAISNDIANSSTNGYKKLDVGFQDLVYETLDRNGTTVDKRSGRVNAPYNGTGVKDANWSRDDTQGPILQSPLDTDLAIDGDGYFKVVCNPYVNGANSAYTRDGNFAIDENGQLVDQNGNKVSVLDDQNNEINAVSSNTANRLRLQEGKFLVDSKGEIFENQGSKTVKVGRIPLYGFVGNTSLESVGDNLFIPQNGAQRYDADGDILQNHLEGSNVDMGEEITKMIIAQRAFEVNSKALTTGDEMWGLVNNLKRS